MVREVVVGEAEGATLGDMEVAHQLESNDGTRKRLWRCHDDALVESVLMPYNDRRRTASTTWGRTRDQLGTPPRRSPTERTCRPSACPE